MLYHRDIGIPSSIKLPSGKFKLKYSGHAKNAAATDKYGDFSPALRYHQTLDTAVAEVIEIQVDDDQKPMKIVYRQPLTGWDGYDIIFVVVAQEWVVKTVWLNHKNDKHRTLNRKKYANPKQT